MPDRPQVAGLNSTAQSITTGLQSNPIPSSVAKRAAPESPAAFMRTIHFARAHTTLFPPCPDPPSQAAASKHYVVPEISKLPSAIAISWRLSAFKKTELTRKVSAVDTN